MPTVPIKSSFQGAPFNRDVAAVIRNVRGAPVNFTTDLHGKLLVSNAKPALDLSHTSIEMVDWVWTKWTEYGGTVTGYSAGTGYRPVTLRAGTNQFSLSRVTSRHHVTTPVGASTLAMVMFEGLSTTHVSGDFSNEFHVMVGVRDTIGASNYGGIWFGRGLNSFSPPGTVENAFFVISNGEALWIPQSAWNVDRLRPEADIANNPSRIQLDLTKINTLIILRAPGSITLGFLYDSVFVPAHRIYVEDWPSTLTGGEFTYPSWKLDCWCSATKGNLGDIATVKLWGGSILQDYDPLRVGGYATVQKTFGAGTTAAMISIAACANAGGSGVFGTTSLGNVSVVTAAAIPVRLNVYKNCTLTTPSWAAGSAQFPYVKTDTVGTISAVGRRVFSMYFLSQATIDLDKVLGQLDFLGSYYTTANSISGETYTIELTNASTGTVSEIFMSANWITSL
jgi:hypothetical protein